MTPNSDPQLYRELSQPFESPTAANAALDGFAQDLAAIRLKHKIRDVVAVLQVNALDPDDPESGEGVMTACVGFGDGLKRTVLLARALGEEQGKFERRLGRLAKPN